eukprot:2074666-Amphidinium_carterae.1
MRSGRSARRHDLSVDHTNNTVTLAIPVSKTDSQAAGAKRTHGCACTPSSFERLCPYHTAI